MGPFIALPCWQMWQNCHFRHICQIHRIRQLLWAPSLLCAFLVGDCGKIVIAAIFATFAAFANFYGPPSLLSIGLCLVGDCGKLSFSPYLPNLPTFMGPLHCFVLCLVGDCGKVVIFAIFAKFPAFANFYGLPSLLCQALGFHGNDRFR